MSVRRRLAYYGLASAGALFCFLAGSFSAHTMLERQVAANEARLTAMHDEMARSTMEIRQAEARIPSGTDGKRLPEVVAASGQPQSAIVEEVKKQLQSEMGLMPVRLLRSRRESFVELNALDNLGKSSYGTAGYLGNGYFITVKHGVV